MDTFERNLKLVELRLGYAWNFFAFHARQRTIMFNFFLISVSIIANAVILAFRFLLPVNPLLASLVSLLLLCIGAFLCFAFQRLDRRNEQLLMNGEQVLSKLEEDMVFDGLGSVDGQPNIPLGFYYREDAEKERMRKLKNESKLHLEEMEYLKLHTLHRYKHAFWIPLIQRVMFWIFALCAALVFGGAVLVCYGIVKLPEDMGGNAKTQSGAGGDVSIERSEATKASTDEDTSNASSHGRADNGKTNADSPTQRGEQSRNKQETPPGANPD